MFEYDLDNDETCEYTINAEDMEYWRLCTQDEIDEALKFLAKKRLAWVNTINKFRKLGQNEQLKFNTNCTGVPGGNVNRTSPMYNTPGIVNPNRSTVSSSRKLITRAINDKWEQKEPIGSMDDDKREFVVSQCIKLKYAFDTYQYDSVRVYPYCGSQVPRRGYPQTFGYGMDAYDELMNGEDWGYYDCD